MNVLSLFDGISCGQIALGRAGINVDNYFASEIDKHAIAITQKNYPNTIQLGDVTNWRSWPGLPPIDLMFGGFPCQDFSFLGKGASFDGDRGKLFFTLVEIWKKVKPKYFLFENVRMKKEYKDFISETLGVEPILINSALVSGQNRNRLYWTNIPDVTQPLDRGIKMVDILENPESMEVDRDKSLCLNHNYFKCSPWKHYKTKRVNQMLLFKMPGRITEDWLYEENGVKEKITNGKHCRMLSVLEVERLQTLPDNYTAGPAKTNRYKAVGNAWTVDVIAHILSHLPVFYKNLNYETIGEEGNQKELAIFEGGFIVKASDSFTQYFLDKNK